MPRYKTETRPGLVALYDIRPGNGAGQFLQPQSLHGANASNIQRKLTSACYVHQAATFNSVVPYQQPVPFHLHFVCLNFIH